MIKSMTGFGGGTYQGDEFTIEVVISTVNHRFIDIQLRLPEELAGAEALVRSVVQRFCHRGRINVTVTMELSEDIAYEVNRPMIRAYLRALEIMKREFDVGGEVDINTLVSLPGAIRPGSSLSDGKGDFNTGLEAALEQALGSVVEMRTMEGKEIGRDLSGRLGEIEKHLDEIERTAPGGLESARERIQKRVEDLAPDLSIDESRIAQEVVLLAQRADISEEINRLKSHIEQFRPLLDGEGAMGRKLEFLVQEMNREVSTIQAKSSHLSISKAAIAIRAEIEKLREQVQNVE